MFFGYANAENLGVYSSNVLPEESKVRIIYSGLNGSWYKGLDKINQKYRENLSHQISVHCDEIILFRLSADLVKEKKKGKLFFPILPYDSYSTVLEYKRITKEDDIFYKLEDSFLSEFSNTELESPFSHIPEYGIRFLLQGEIIYETSVSTQTGNFYIPYPEGSPWVGMNTESFGKIADSILKKKRANQPEVATP